MQLRLKQGVIFVSYFRYCFLFFFFTFLDFLYFEIFFVEQAAAAQTGCEESCRYFQYPSQTHPAHLVGFILESIEISNEILDNIDDIFNTSPPKMSESIWPPLCPHGQWDYPLQSSKFPIKIYLCISKKLFHEIERPKKAWFTEHELYMHAFSALLLSWKWKHSDCKVGLCPPNAL